MFEVSQFPESVQTYMIEKRRHLHAHPELSLKETQTRDYLANELEELGISHQVVGITGLLAELKGDRPGPTLLIRCEMDALPLLEETGLEFASEEPGVMHACGHDAHMAILLGLMKYLIQEDVAFCGQLLFLFQPAEEIGAGAKMVLEDFDQLGITLDEAIGVHLGSELPTGIISIHPGSVMSGTRTMKAQIRGKGGHASRPDATVDPINAMLNFLSTAQRLKDRSISPMDDAVLSFTGVHAGTKANIVPETCEVWASMRFFKEEVGEKLRDILIRTARGTEEATGVTIELAFSKGLPPVRNDFEVTRKCKAAAIQTFGADYLLQNERIMASDDFGRFLERWPGCYAFAGAGLKDQENHPGHSPKFDLDEGAMPYIVTYFLNYISNQD